MTAAGGRRWTLRLAVGLLVARVLGFAYQGARLVRSARVDVADAVGRRVERHLHLQPPAVLHGVTAGLVVLLALSVVALLRLAGRLGSGGRSARRVSVAVLILDVSLSLLTRLQRWPEHRGYDVGPSWLLTTGAVVSAAAGLLLVLPAGRRPYFKPDPH